MRGFLVVGLVATAALSIAPFTAAQAEVVNSKFDGVVFEAFPGKGEVGHTTFANLNFQWCYDQGGVAPPQEQVTITLEITAKPEWLEVSFSASEVKFNVDNTKAPAQNAADRCKVPSPAIQAGGTVLDSAKGGESGTVDILIKGTKVGNIKAPADATASSTFIVASKEQDVLTQLQENSTGGPDVGVDDVSPSSNDSPGFDLLIPAAVGAAVLVAAVRRRKS